MHQDFEISYWWEKREIAGSFFKIVDASKLSVSLDYFLSIYQGQFKIYIKGYEAVFDLDPDLSTIFEEIPNVLTQLTKNTDRPVEFDFYEQGTDLGMLMQRKDDFIVVRFETAPGSGIQFKDLPESYFSIVADQFFEQWLLFIKALLKSLINFQPELENDESYQQYYSQLKFVRSAI